MSQVGPKVPRSVPFLASILYSKARFAILSRYLIFNSVTGAHGLYITKCRNQKEWRESFFPKLVRNHPKFKRDDMRNYVIEYINKAYKTVGMPLITKN